MASRVTISSIILLLTNVCLTTVSIYWAVSSWSSFVDARSEKQWIPSVCSVINTSVFGGPISPIPFQWRQGGPSSSSSSLLDNGFYCPVITVNITSIVSNTTFAFSPVMNVSLLNLPVSAAAAGARGPLQRRRGNGSTTGVGVEEVGCGRNRSKVEAAMSGLVPGLVLNCWLSPPPYGADAAPIVSLWPIRTGVRAKHINLIIISTVLAVAALLSLSAIAYLLCIPHPGYFLPTGAEDLLNAAGPLHHLQHPPPATTAPVTRAYGHNSAAVLSPAAVDAILADAVHAYEQYSAELASDHNTFDRTCPICLEEGLGARLSCNHAFHPHCIRHWLSRGGQTCPLCCMVVKPPVSPASSAASSSSATSAASPSVSARSTDATAATSEANDRHGNSDGANTNAMANASASAIVNVGGGSNGTNHTNVNASGRVHTRDLEDDLLDLLQLPSYGQLLAHNNPLSVVQSPHHQHQHQHQYQHQHQHLSQIAAAALPSRALSSPLSLLSHSSRSRLMRRTFTFARLPVPYGSSIIHLPSAPFSSAGAAAAASAAARAPRRVSASASFPTLPVLTESSNAPADSRENRAEEEEEEEEEVLQMWRREETTADDDDDILGGLDVPAVTIDTDDEDDNGERAN